VIIPEDAGLAVLKGAVQFGFNPKVINPRISRFTYGVSTNKNKLDSSQEIEMCIDFLAGRFNLCLNFYVSPSKNNAYQNLSFTTPAMSDKSTTRLPK
jgi:hypothetical protein